MHIRWWWQRNFEGREKLEHATAEAARSEELHTEDRRVTQTVKEISRHNMFAEIIRRALVGGYAADLHPRPPKEGT